MAEEKAVLTLFINTKGAKTSMSELTKDANKLRREIKNLDPTTKEFIDTSKKLAQVETRMRDLRNQTKGLGKEVGGLKGVFAGTFLAGFAQDAIGATIQWGKELFNTSLALEQQDKKAATVFGNMLGYVEDFADKSARDLGLTNQEFVNLATSAGDLLIPMQFTREQAAKMSTDLVGLSGALSEWTNGEKSAAEVSDILTKAMLGEREQLKTLGIAIQEADVSQRLMEKGQKNLTGVMLQQAKATATMELIYEKSADAQTAFANNADSNIRKVAKMEATVKNLEEGLAEGLTPVFAEVVDVAAEVGENIDPVVSVFSNWWDTVKMLFGVLGDLVTAIIPVGKEGSTVATVMKTVATVMNIAITPFRLLATYVKLNVDAFTALINKGKQVANFFGAEFEIDPNATFGNAMENLKTNLVDIKDSYVDIWAENTETVKKETNTQVDVHDKAAEKIIQKDEKAAEKRRKSLEKLAETLTKIENDLLRDKMSKVNQEISTAEEKYAKLAEQAEGNAKLLKRIEDLKGREIAAIRLKYEQEAQEEIRKAAEEAMKKHSEADKKHTEQLEAYKRELRYQGLTEEEQFLTDLEEKYAEMETFYADNAEKLNEIRKQKEEEYQAWRMQKEMEVAQQIGDFLEKEIDNQIKFQYEQRRAREQKATDEKLAQLEKEKQAELKAAGTTEAGKARIEEEYAKKEKAIKREAWEREQKAKAEETIIAGILASIKALPNYILAGITLAFSGLAAARIMAVENPYYKGGFTSGLGYKDGTGHEVAGVVHADEYVVPSHLLHDPWVMDQVGVIEAMRTGRAFADGGFTTPPVPSGRGQSPANDQDFQLMITFLMSIDRKLDALNNSTRAHVVLDDINEQEKRLNTIQSETRA